MLKLSSRLASVRPSATLEVKQEADRLRAEGMDIVDFGPGEPDFNTPENVKGAAHRAIDENLSHYLPTLGLPDLRRALSERYKRLHGADYAASEVIVSCGGKNALFDAALALFDAGDEVVVPAPYWVSFPEQIRLAGARPVILPTEESDGFIARARRAREVLTAATKAIVLCSPSNPTGAVIPSQELAAFADLALEKDLYLVFDECYECFVYGGAGHFSLAREAGRIKDRLILVSTLSKSYAMTGWRVGYALADRPVIAAMATVQGHDCTHTAAVAQAAALEALRGPQDALAAMVAEYARRREVMVAGLRSVPGVTCAEPAGAFYAFPNVADLCRRLGARDDGDLAGLLLRRARIAAVPGQAFGASGYLRFSYALSADRIREGLDRLRAAASR